MSYFRFLKPGFLQLLLLCIPFTAAVQELSVIPQPAAATVTNTATVLPAKMFRNIYTNAGLGRSYILSVFGELGIAAGFTNEKKNAGIELLLDTKQKGKKGGYMLDLAASVKNKITITANTTEGLLNGLQTLRQLIGRDGSSIHAPGCRVSDTPEFSWRAFMLDESRHFHGMATVKKLLDEMARLKMNIFHWHLVDDPGWRIEIRKYPLLTTIGSKRDHSHTNLSWQQWDSLFPGRKMFYTQAELKEMVRYAADRGIRIIPEIEVPGHASASIYAYPWLGSSSSKEKKLVYGDLYNITDPRVEGFIHDVLDEVLAIFPSKIIHIGGDEANYTHWKNREDITAFMKKHDIPTHSDLQVWAINRLSRYLAGKGAKMIGWNEITGDNIRLEAHVKASEKEKLAPGTIVQFWDGEVSLVNKAIHNGFDVVNSDRHYTYLDYSYETTPLEKAYAFNPVPEGLSGTDTEKILGLGCQMWGEAIPDTNRLYYQVFPRIAAMAECAWTAPARKDYSGFTERLKKMETIWKSYGYWKL
ncbi:beta-N-acetylhexosaminidase [Niabella beijingensis]|uniref:beta-N-acetylhexosaminidase n=1 Tax=Niabella beijingensis TaxID=2872700 RepID=UPI001CBDD1A7|nr:beta-N-acetylhexosaminidase [Niabella beijingensis]MBZ4189905.1 beta-N-acetylhexosaminidase [Niabella beijingensis]